MKVLLVIRWPVGGIRTYLRYIYTQSVFKDCQFTLIATDVDFKGFAREYLTENQFEFVFTDDNNKALMAAYKQVLSTNKFDIVHAHGFSSGALMASLPRLMPRRSVMTAHDVFLPQQFKGWKGKLKLLGINLLFSRFDHVLTVGADACKNFSEFIPALPQRKIKNIDHGVDAKRFAVAEVRHYRAEFDSQNRKIIGFFGRFMSQKGFLDVIKAMKLLSARIAPEEMPLVLTFGWGGFIREDYALIDQLGLSDYFRQLPFTDDVPAAIKGVDVVVMPSRWEACGLLAMEVLCAGKPLVATNCIGLRCVVEGTPARVVDPYSPDQLADAIQAALADEGTAFKDFQQEAVNRFDLHRPALELYRFYQAILEGAN
ncbi:glycosyltransferase family 4 protein [Cellvibrio mixtus]|uniref:glycosyltransferase family 4 protein n=1 Tax=Cellvibrio mixtus TaxID=39650 RepID=UPI0005880542|nr:glycosyltransferase family 4 protein [Cellvibrio mixtus]